MASYIEKLLNFTIKARQLEALLTSLGFEKRSTKGSHVKWIKEGLPPLIIATHDKEVRPYQLKQVIKILEMDGVLNEKEKTTIQIYGCH